MKRSIRHSPEALQKDAYRETYKLRLELSNSPQLNRAYLGCVLLFVILA